MSTLKLILIMLALLLGINANAQVKTNDGKYADDEVVEDKNKKNI